VSARRLGGAALGPTRQFYENPARLSVKHMADFTDI
jgi:hypothetical protein